MPLPAIAVDRPWIYPAVGLTYAGAVALALLSADQLAAYMPGPWFDLLALAVLGFALLTLAILLVNGWRRNREGLRGRALAIAGGALAAGLLALVAIYGLIENASVSAVISGADVRLTKPVMDSLPRPPGTKLFDETPGLQGTESISEDISANNLSTVIPFYARELAKRGWVEDKTSAGTPIVRFSKGDFVLSVAIDPPSSAYTVTVDHIVPTPTASPSATVSASP
ncbi:MAG TPA: hypothetical protein VIT43_07355 [Candidatus Dormibacteraeota bacterium]